MPVQRSTASVVDAVAKRFREQALSGPMKHRSALPELVLTRQFGAPRPSERSALQALPLPEHAYLLKPICAGDERAALLATRERLSCSERVIRPQIDAPVKARLKCLAHAGDSPT